MTEDEEAPMIKLSTIRQDESIVQVQDELDKAESPKQREEFIPYA